MAQKICIFKVGTKNVKKKRSASHRSRRGEIKHHRGMKTKNHKKQFSYRLFPVGQDLFLCAGNIYTSG